VDVLNYHQRTKHSISYGYAKGPESIDWDAQPDPFRTYDGAPLIELPLAAHEVDTPWARLWQSASVNEVPLAAASAAAIDFTTLAKLLELALGLSAWKQYGTARWSLRCNPSSGNLHPTECYVLVRNIAGLADGVYHYRADLHALERRCAFAPSSDVQSLVWLGFSSVHWREAWKYGERAFRYCQHDVGHALAAVSFAAKTLGVNSRQLAHIPIADEALAQLLGLNRHTDFNTEARFKGDQELKAEQEDPDCLLTLTGEVFSQALLSDIQQALAQGTWQGQANTLDPRHMYQWPIIDEVASATAINHEATNIISDKIASSRDCASPWPQPLSSSVQNLAAQLIKQRRSAQAFDPNGSMSFNDFYCLLDHCLPRIDFPPSNVLPLANKVHFLLFVHNVEGLDSGLYALPRSLSALDALKSQLRGEFNWQPVANAPEHLPLYLLLKCSSRRTIAKLSGQQAIAGDSAFSLAMIGEFQDIEQQPWNYRHLFWQAGALGQVLYLEAEAMGLRGTGIGCYFDDAVHDMLGLKSDGPLQVLYHFTLGRPLIDNRITSWTPYRQR
jgi:SagB-type dehydrogenase family enzyme|tara:strand:- start:2792 stop:4465 length:1674 start_codon:yes stop_codon:yes gene_type:complete